MPTVTCTRDGLIIDGRSLYMLAGQIHYFRYPRAEWRDILWQAKAAGLNTVDTVIPWNLHEPTPGHFDFDDLADLPGYIDLCAELGLYFIARPGPYICAEWENGGLPAWLGQADDIVYRLDHPAYLEPLLRWFDTLIPLLAERQVDRGGPILLVQIENEHWASGVYGHDAHQQTLAEAMTERGIRVPYYTCMGAGGSWPEFRNGWTGIDRKLAQTRRLWPETPLIVSELWSGWFDDWGSSRHTGKSAASLDQRLHELTAIGASGFSHWMWAGGTNFGFWGGRTVGGDSVLMTASYDYDAPVSEYGGLTDKYFVARRHHLLLGTLGTTLASLLASAQPGGPQVIAPKAIAGRAAGGGEPHRNVQNGDFTATTLRNDTPERQTYQLFVDNSQFTIHNSQLNHLSIDVEPFTLKPIFTHLPLTDHLTLRYHTGRILGFLSMAGADVLVMYGFKGEQGELALSGPGWHLIDADGTQATVTDDHLHLRYWLTDRPTLVRVTTGIFPNSTPSQSPPARGRSRNLPPGGGESRSVTILLLTQSRAERCWPLGERGFLVGPHYLHDYEIKEDQITAQVDSRGVTPCYWLGSDGTRRRLSPPATPPAAELPSLGPWETLAVTELTAQEAWQALEGPLPFEKAGCYLGYGWYRAKIESADEKITLAAPWLSDRGHLFVDEDYAGTFGIDPQGPMLTVRLSLAAGQHDLRLLVDNLGRFNYGSGLGERKGLLDTLYGGGKQTDISRGWTALWQEAYFAGEAIAGAKPAHVRADATDVDLRRFPFSGSDVWLLREVEVPAGHRALLYFTGDRNPGALYVNGQQVTRFSRHYGGGFHKYDVTDWLNADGQNVIALFIRDYGGLAWQGTLLTYDPNQPLAATWSFRPGVTATTADRRPMTDDQSIPNLQFPNLPISQPFDFAPFDYAQDRQDKSPRFFKTHFAYTPADHGPGPFKLSVYGLRKGQLWLNGRNLGRYWQIGPQEFYKVPVSWLAAENELLIFEEAAGSPEGVRLAVDALGASRMGSLTWLDEGE